MKAAMTLSAWLGNPLEIQRSACEFGGVTMIVA
jgi:hypothetical protein